MRNKLIEGGYFLLLIFALIITILFGAYATAQTPQQVQKYLDSIGVQHADIVTNQAKLETGNFNCQNCSMDHNNLFGFQLSGKYLHFDTWKESCEYYQRWQKRHYKGQNYYDFLNCIWQHRDGRCAKYATDPEYIDKLQSI